MSKRAERVSEIMKHAHYLDLNRLTLATVLAFQTDKEIVTFHTEFMAKPAVHRIPPIELGMITEGGVRKWVRELHAKGLLYNFDDNPSEIITLGSDEPLFNSKEITKLIMIHTRLNLESKRTGVNYHEILMDEGVAILSES